MHELTLRPDPSGLWASIPVSPSIPMRAGISLLTAGDMAIARRHEASHRALLLELAGCPPRAFGLRQVHSCHVITVTDQDPEQLARTEADGMITDLTGTTLTVTIADCLPIFLVDTVTGAFGLVHSGWKGTGIVVDALAAMTARFGTRPRDVVATIGPGIGPCCYRVPEERAALFSEQFGAEAVARDRGPEPRLNLRAANVALLLRAGVPEAGVVTECTCCSPRLGSFRRQGPESYTLMCAFLARVRG